MTFLFDFSKLTHSVSVQPIKIPILAATPKPTIKTSSSGKRKNKKTCFVCRSVDHLIKDLLPKSKTISVTAVRQVSAVVPKIMKSRPRPAHPLNRKSNPSIRSDVKENKGKWVWRPKCPILDHDSRTTGNMSYLFDFQELNGGYVAFGANPKGGKILGKGKIKTCKLDFEDVYFVKELKFNLFSASQMCDNKNKVLFTDSECLVLSPDFKMPDENQVLLRAEAVNTACYVQNRVLVTKPQKKTPYELLHGRTPNIGFMRPFGCHVTILNTLDSLGKFEGKVDEGFLVGYSVNSKAFRNKEGDATFNGKEHDAVKHESTVNLSSSSSALSGEQDDMTKKKDKGKSPVDYFTGNSDFNEDFEDYSEDSDNDVSAAGPIVPTAGQNYSNSTNPISAAGPIVPAAGHNYSNSTNPISAAGPSNSNTSPTHGQSSLRDIYLPPDMVEREDIVYPDHENVGAEADFNNLETSITISPIPTTRTHNAHPIS
nr:retrovirus-related Pol polyprotein from transposon TNT 1-94 [Tanacetum cinerariifolium]